MDAITEFLNSIIGSSNPIFLYIIAGAIIVFSIIFIRRILQAILILTILSVLYITWSHFSGNPIPIELPSEFSLDAIIGFMKNIMGMLLDLLPDVPVDDAVDKASEIVKEQ